MISSFTTGTSSGSPRRTRTSNSRSVAARDIPFTMGPYFHFLSAVGQNRTAVPSVPRTYPTAERRRRATS